MSWAGICIAFSLRLSLCLLDLAWQVCCSLLLSSLLIFRFFFFFFYLSLSLSLTPLPSLVFALFHWEARAGKNIYAVNLKLQLSQQTTTAPSRYCLHTWRATLQPRWQPTALVAFFAALANTGSTLSSDSFVSSHC